MYEFIEFRLSYKNNREVSAMKFAKPEMIVLEYEEKERNNGMQLSNIIDTKNNTNKNITSSQSIPSVKENKQPSVGL